MLTSFYLCFSQGGHIIPVAPRDVFGTQQFMSIPAGHVWIEGDNSPASHDSRAFGPVPAALIQGRVVATVWPFSALSRVK